MLSFGVVCGFICIKYNITKADKTLKRSREGLKTTNFRRLPRRWKAQSAQFFFMKSKFKVRLLHKNSVCSSTTPGKLKTGFGKLPIF